MTILDHAKETIQNGHIEIINKRHLYLAYLMFYMKNLTLHPDDFMCENGGHTGYEVLLVNEVLNVRGTGASSLPDNFIYPCAFVHLYTTLLELQAFHESIFDDDPTEVNRDYLGYVNSLLYFVQEMKPSEVEEAVDHLQKLYLYHANENDSNDEENDKPAAILRNCADVLHWIQQFHY